MKLGCWVKLFDCFVVPKVSNVLVVWTFPERPLLPSKGGICNHIVHSGKRFTFETLVLKILLQYSKHKTWSNFEKSLE